MALTQEALDRAGLKLSPSEFESLVLEAVESLSDQLPAADPRRDLTATEVEALERGGGIVDRPDDGSVSALARSAAKYAALLSTSYTVNEVARLLGVDRSRIRQRLAERSLYGIKVGGEWRIPRFQFDAERLLPGIEQVMPKLRRGLHPLAVYNWFTLPEVDLEIDDHPVSPRDWLRSGGDPAEVAELAAWL